MSIEVGDAIQPFHPLLSPSPPALNLSRHQGLFQWVCSSHQYWSFSISPSNEYSGLISFRMDWCDLLAFQRTLKNLLQHHSSKASILRHSAFLMVQLSHPYMTTGKTIALTMWTFMGKVMPLFFNTLSRFIIAFLPRAKSLLIYKQLLPCLDKVGGFSQQFPHSTRLLAICFFVCVCLLHSFHGLSFLFRCY